MNATQPGEEAYAHTPFRGRFSLSFARVCNTFRPLVRQPAPALSVLLVLLLSAVPAAGEEQPTVKSIRVEGNRRVEVDAIKAAISEKPGAPFDRHKVDADIRALMKLGFFSDVVIEVEGSPQQPELVYKVTERPAVRSTSLEGNEELSKDDFKDVVDIKAFSILDIAAIRRNVKKIQDKYVEKGYYLAEVTYRIDPQPDNQVTVVFVINEHAKVQVKQIEFLGNAHIPRGDLTSVMQTQEGGFFSFLTSAGTYKEEAFQRDLQAIGAVYRDQGYMNARVNKPSISISPDRQFLYISIRIEEGDQFRIGKIDFSGELLHEKSVIAKFVASKPGEVLSFTKIGRDLFAIADFYHDEGYAYANVNPATNVDAKARIVDVTFEVQPGQKAYFERIEVAGNSRTRDKVIRRELSIYEGELYSGTGVRTSKQRVTKLGYFETVEISTRKGSAEDKIIATIEVKERSTGSFQVGAGFSSYENFILTGQIAQNNLFGWGQTLSLQGQWSSIRHLFQVEFIEPYFFDTKWTFAFSLYQSEAAYTTFTRNALGGSMTWGYELNGLADLLPWTKNLEDLRLFATYTNEFAKVTSTANDVLLYNRFTSGTNSSLRLSLQWDKRDNALFPTSGTFQSLSAEFAPPFLAPHALFGEEVNLYTKYSLDSRFYKPLGGGVVARAKLALGYIRDWDAAHPVPISELFYTGGINSIRGYRTLGVSPTVQTGVGLRPDSSLQSFNVGGNKELIFNFEVQFPLIEKLGFRGVVFTDMGNVFAAGRYTDPNVSLSLYKSVGFGVRWFSPIGPLRFEWGIPLNRRRDAFTGAYLDDPIDFQFTVGNSF